MAWQPTSTIREFAQAPVGRFYRAPHVSFWCATPSLAGTISHGPFERADAEALLILAEMAAAGPLSLLHDASAVESFSPQAFTTFLNRETRCAAQIVKQAVVLPKSYYGATIAGLCLFAQQPTKTFLDRAAAFDWLEAEMPAELGAVGSQTAQTEILLTLRAVLRNGGGGSLHEAARSVHVSTRSLQRHLHAAGTSFGREAVLAKIERSKALLLDASLPITRVALDVGFESPQHFSRVFRAETGATPSTWREAAR